MTVEQINDIKTVEFFKVLSHETRVNIISLLYGNMEMSYTELQHTLNIEEGNLNFHLRKMKGFIELTEKKNYRLSEYGKIAYTMLHGMGLWKDANEIIKADDGGALSVQILMRRTAAALVDFTLFVFIGVVLFLVLNHGIKLDVYTFLIVIYLQLALQFAYVCFVIMEAHNGKTIGKYLMRIRIVKTNGDKVTILESAIRNIGKVFLLPLDILIGLLFYRKKGYIKFMDYYTQTKVETV
jgi:uncharacterized RDD family membrane protein YckC/DNA-binding HxlR family transcriptional regulator